MEETQLLCGLKREDFQTTIDGKKTDLYVLRNSQGNEVALTNYGGAVVAIMMPDKEGKHANIIQGHDSIKGVMESPEPYLSTLVGRYANRIARGRFQLHGKEYSLAINNGPNCLHGGKQGFNAKVWDATQVNPHAVVMKYTSPYGEEGFSGEVVVWVAFTLTDADGETKHTNNVGIKGLYFDAIMDACIEIDYENQKAKMGVFYDARPEEAQKIAAEGDAKGLYARFVPTLVTRTAAAWASPWKFDEVNLGNPNYAWAWFPLQADLKTFMYYNRSGNNVEFSILSQYANTTMNQIAGIDVVATATADGTPSTYSNVYQVNAKGKPGTSFVRK